MPALINAPLMAVIPLPWYEALSDKQHINTLPLYGDQAEGYLFLQYRVATTDWKRQIIFSLKNVLRNYYRAWDVEEVLRPGKPAGDASYFIYDLLNGRKCAETSALLLFRPGHIPWRTTWMQSIFRTLNDSPLRYTRSSCRWGIKWTGFFIRDAGILLRHSPIADSISWPCPESAVMWCSAKNSWSVRSGTVFRKVIVKEVFCSGQQSL